LIVDLIPEVVQVRRDSVVALVHRRGDHGDHLTLGRDSGDGPNMIEP
jgi:hypothetical protein